MVTYQPDQSWVFIGRTDAKTETPILWPPHVKSWLIGKDPDAGRDWGQEAKGTTEDEILSLTWCTWVWVNSESWWWTGRPGMLRFMGSQRVRHDWANELSWTEPFIKPFNTHWPASLLLESSPMFAINFKILNDDPWRLHHDHHLLFLFLDFTTHKDTE